MSTSWEVFCSYVIFGAENESGVCQAEILTVSLEELVSRLLNVYEMAIGKSESFVVQQIFVCIMLYIIIINIIILFIQAHHNISFYALDNNTV